VIGQHLHSQQLQTVCIRLDLLEGHEGQVQCVHMGHHAHCKSCHSEAFAVPVLDDLCVSQAPLQLAFARCFTFFTNVSMIRSWKLLLFDFLMTYTSVTSDN